MPHNKNLLVKNANIITMNDRQPYAKALCIQNGRIVFIGETVEAEKQVSVDAPILDADGATIVPGLIDSHMHLAHTGLTASSLDLVNATSAEEIVEMVRQVANEIEAGKVIFATRLDDSHLKNNRYPTRWELDAAAPRHPVLLRHRTGHGCVLNSLALERAQIPATTPGIQLDETSKPNGLLLAQANGIGQMYFKGEIYRQTGMEHLVQLVVKEALQAGLTTIHALEDANIIESLLALLPELPLRIIIYPQTRDVNQAASFGLGRFGGCGISCLDGDIGSPMTAAVLEPYACDPTKRGCLYFEDEELKALVLDAHQRGLQVSMHTVGDRAVAQGLMAIEYAQGCDPRPDARHRIEHWELHHAESSRKAVDLGVWTDIQPPFNHFWPHNTAANIYTLGEPCVERLDPISDLFQAGMQIAGGSDSPVTPLSPMLGIHCAVNHSNPSQRIQPRQALEMFTIQAARIAFEERDKGTLEVGKLGDLTVLGENPLTVDPTTIKDIPVLYTVVSGDVVYRR